MVLSEELIRELNWILVNNNTLTKDDVVNMLQKMYHQFNEGGYNKEDLKAILYNSIYFLEYED